MKRSELEQFLNQTLKPQDFPDYGPNGLQIEGQETINKIAFAVSATKDSITQAIEAQAQAMIVHHGLFWSFHGVRTITGTFAKRVRPLIENQINLFGYHLPLDAHLEIGNAASLAHEIGLQEYAPFGDYKGVATGVQGKFTTSIDALELQKKLQDLLGRDVLHAQGQKSQISSMGIITGGANGGWLDAAKQGLDAYLTGEMSEHDWNEAQEAGVHMFAGGHHATEKFGIQSLQRLVAQKFPVETLFIDSQNPA